MEHDAQLLVGRAIGRSHKVGRGHVGTGELAHEWAHRLRESILEHHVPIEVPDPGTEHGRRLIEALGASYQPHPHGLHSHGDQSASVAKK